MLQDQHNAFVNRNQRELDQTTGRWQGTSGAGGQRRPTRHITTPADTQSQEGIRPASCFSLDAAPLSQQAPVAKPDEAVPDPCNPAACPMRTAQAAPHQTWSATPPH